MICNVLYYGKFILSYDLGDFMKLKMVAVNFPHKKGEFCHKTRHPHYTICCFVTPFLYLYNGKLVKGEIGDIVINTPNEIVYHGPRSDSDEGFVNDWMYIEDDDLAELLEKYPVPLNVAFNIGMVPFLKKCFNDLVLEYNSEISGRSDMIKSIITQMVITMHRAYRKQNFQAENYYLIQSVRRAIIKNPERNWSLKMMSEMSGYSVSRFSELYHKLYNISPINDVIAHRISLAKALLLSGQASISYVATACGFKTINYFSKFFKVSTGYSPSEYINFKK